MKILIVAATRPEIEPFLLEWEKNAIHNSNIVEFLITGVGMTATAFQLGRKLSETKDFDLIINAGIAGSFDYGIPLGTVIHIVEDRIVELGVEIEEGFISIEELGFGKSIFKGKQVENKKNHPAIADLPQLNAITVNTVHGKTSSISTLKKNYPNIQIESMEGAAVFFAAEHFNLPCIQIRSLSNYVESRNKDNWNIPLAIHNLNSWLIQYIIRN